MSTARAKSAAPKNDLTKGPVASSLARLTAPMVLGVSSSILVQTLEMGFIGQLSTQHVAAITFTFPLTMLLTSIALGIGIGTSSVIARSVGAGDAADMRRLATHSLVLIAVLMSALSVVLWLLMDPIFTLLGASPQLLALIHTYLDIYLPGTVLFTLTMILGNIMRANGEANIPGMVMTVGAFANLVIDPFLIFGWLWFPRMELAGAATAMTITRVITTAVMLYYVLRGHLLLPKLNLDKFWQSAKRILHIGFPAMATQLIGPVTGLIVTRMLAQHGEVVVAGFGVATRIEAVAAMLLFALSGSIGPFVGQNWGAKETHRVHQGVRASYQFCLIWGFIMAVPLLFFGPQIAGWIEPSAEVALVAGLYLGIVPLSYGAWGVLMMASASFNALGKPLPSTVLAFTRMFVIYIPLAMVLNHYYGYVGIFVATLTSNLVLACVAYVWFRSRLKNMAQAV